MSGPIRVVDDGWGGLSTWTPGGHERIECAACHQGFLRKLGERDALCARCVWNDVKAKERALMLAAYAYVEACRRPLLQQAREGTMAAQRELDAAYDDLRDAGGP